MRPGKGYFVASGTARSRKRTKRRQNNTVALTERIRRISPAGWMALGACAITLVLTLLTLQAPSREYDEGVYWQSLRAMADGHALFGSVFNSQPPLFLLSIFPFYMLFGQSLAAARLALVVFALAGIAATYVAGRALGHRFIGAVACLLLALDPLYQHGAHTLQAELPSVALQLWAVASTVLATRASGQRQRWLTVGAGVLLGCALLIKLYAIAAIVPIVLYLCAPVTRRWLNDHGHLKHLRWNEIQRDFGEIAPLLGWLTAGLVGIVAFVMVPFIGQLGVVYDQVVRFHLAAARVDSHSLGANLRIIGGSLIATPLFYTAVLAVIVFVWRRLWSSLPLLLWALAAFVTLARQHPLFGHHVVLMSPALALISGVGACVVWQNLAASGGRRSGLTIARVVLVLVCATGLAVDWKQNAAANSPHSSQTLSMAIALQSVSAPDEMVLSDNQYVAALANRSVPPQLVDTSAVRITSGYLTTTQLEDFVTRNRIHVILFASGRFDMLRGFRRWVAARYTEVASFDHGGALYLLEPGSNPPV